MSRMFRRPTLRHLSVFAALAVAGFTAGCDEPKVALGSDIETEQSDYIEGKRLVGEGKTTEALMAFNRVILSRREAPESHLEAAALCMSQKDPLQAIYHYRRFLALRPDAPQVESVKQRIRGAEKMFLDQLPFMSTPEGNAEDRVADVQEKLKQLRRENDQLKQQLAAALAGGRPAPSVARSAPVDSAPAPATPTPAATTPATNAARRTYVVVQGDTLSRISQKMYGNKNRWNEILAANPDKLRNGASSLKVGETLVIP